MAIIFTLVAGCSDKSGDTGGTELNSNSEMLAAGLKFRSNPHNQSVAYKYLNLLVREKQYVTALTILDEMSGRYSGEVAFRKLYADIIRMAASGSGIETFNSAYYGLRETNAEMDTLLMRINSIRSISRRITKEGPDVGLYLGERDPSASVVGFQWSRVRFRPGLSAGFRQLPVFLLQFISYLPAG